MKTSKIQHRLRSSVLEQIYISGEISRTDIATATGITPATTTSITADLIQQGIVEEIGESTQVKPKVGRKKNYSVYEKPILIISGAKFQNENLPIHLQII